MTAKLLIIEDDYTLAAGLAYLLRDEGFELDLAHDAINGLELAQTNEYDIILCDRMLPGMDGVELLRRLRESGHQTKLLFLTAKDSIKDKVEGLDAGAEDYISKPFSSEELLARLRVLLRRSDDRGGSAANQYADLEIPPGDNKLHCNGLTETLTPKETQLLLLFFRNPETVLSRKYILESVWGTSNFIEENNIDISVHYIRQKIARLESKVQIRTVRGVGYTIEQSSDA